jgi:DNA-binding protein H-NS
MKEVTMPTLEQIKDKMKKLQEQADKLIAKRAQFVLTDIRKLMEEHGLTTADIEPNSAEKKNRVRPAGSKSTAPTRKVPSTTAVNGARPAKYRHAKTGATWTGHGRAPAWIADAKDRRKFLIDGTDAGSGSKLKTAVKKAAVVGVAGAHKGQPKGPQPARYRDPKTGATWSGRGPAPASLSGAKDRAKFLIDGASVATDTGVASKPKSAGKKAATKTVVAKKAIAAK